MVARGLARSRNQARALIVSGRVRLNGVVVTRPAVPVLATDQVGAAADPYVSRAAHKLLGALADLRLQVTGRALDAGASTGGFTQVLVERGCRRVYAVDVGSGQLAPELRADPRVTSREGVNLRDLGLQHLDGAPVDLVVADVSFISLTLLVGPLAAVLHPEGLMLLLVKPQFEVGRHRLGKGGVVGSGVLRAEAVETVVRAAEPYGWHPVGTAPSRLLGANGNQEVFVALRCSKPPDPSGLCWGR